MRKFLRESFANPENKPITVAISKQKKWLADVKAQFERQDGVSAKISTKYNPETRKSEEIRQVRIGLRTPEQLSRWSREDHFEVGFPEGSRIPHASYQAYWQRSDNITMASIKIDAQELRKILELTPAEQNIMLVGRHGIGKSEVIRAYHEALGRRVVALFLGQMADPGDLIGLLRIDEKQGRTDFIPPYWWPEPDQPIVLFLDELNRARPEVLQSVMDLTLNRRLAGKQLPAGSYVIAAVNEGDEYQLTDLDPALVSRFNIYEFAPTVDDWLVWATDRELDARVVQFIQENPGWLDGTPSRQTGEPGVAVAGADLEKSPDRRGWERVARLLAGQKTLDDILLKLTAGIIGSPAAVEFFRQARKRPELLPEDVLLRFGKAKPKLKRLQVPDLANLNEQMLLWMQAQKLKAAEKKTVLKNMLGYLELMRDNQQNEVLAYLASKLNDPRFDNVSLVLFGSQPILDLMTSYVKGIELK